MDESACLRLKSAAGMVQDKRHVSELNSAILNICGNPDPGAGTIKLVFDMRHSPFDEASRITSDVERELESRSDVQNAEMTSPGGFASIVEIKKTGNLVTDESLDTFKSAIVKALDDHGIGDVSVDRWGIHGQS